MESATKKLREEEFLINMGPQHPSTHGVLRLVLKMEGEFIRELTPHVGYLHRSIEKIAENRTYNQCLSPTVSITAPPCPPTWPTRWQ
jgi:NADH-quinone oxidoreductase subunit D